MFGIRFRDLNFHKFYSQAFRQKSKLNPQPCFSSCFALAETSIHKI